MNNLKQLAVAIAVALITSTSAQAIVITPDTSAASLASAVASGGGLSVVGTPTLSGHTSGTAVSSGTYTNISGTYLIGGGIVLSSGDVNDYNDGPNVASGNTTSYGVAATAAQEALLDPITGGSLDHNDVTQLNIDFITSTGSVFFNVVFGSDEWAEFIGSSFIDAFGLYLDGVNIAFFAGLPINIDHPSMGARLGTELDGVLPAAGLPMGFSASGLDTSTHTLTFIIADSGDSILDSTAYISGLSGTAPPATAVPEPASLALLAFGLAGICVARRRNS